MLERTFTDSVSAFKGINKMLIFEEELVKEHGFLQASQANLYNLLVRVERSYVPDAFDFSSLANYRPAKATSLINNYIDRDYLDEIVAQVLHKELKKAKAYNLAFHFTNLHDGGKGCLLTCTFTRRYGEDTPILIATIRASESFKRLMFDLLLLQRMGELAYGDEPFALEIYFPYVWGVPDWLSMYLKFDKKSRIKAKKAEKGTFANKVYEKYLTFKNMPREEMEAMKYHATKRSWKVINDETTKPHYLASDFKL